VRNLAARIAGHAAGTADAERVLLFSVEVQEVLRLEQPGLKISGAGQARLFVNGEDELQRPVVDIVALHHSQGRRDAYAIIRTESGAIGIEPAFALHDLDRIGIEVVLRAFVLLAHHVEMSL
jgi:hypothetical protein